MTTRSTLLIFSAAVACGQAFAQSDPWYVGVSQSFGHNSNVRRAPGDAAESSGLISSSRLVGGLNLQPGRQRIYADANISRNTLSKQKEFDYNGYGLNAGIDWETVGNLSGTVNLAADKSAVGVLGEPGDFDTPTGGRNLEELTSLLAVFRLGSPRTSRLWFEAEFSRDEKVNDIDHGEPIVIVTAPGDFIEADRSERKLVTTGLGVGAKYRVGGALVVGIGAHATRGEEARTDHELDSADSFRRSDNFDRDDVDFTANWDPSGASRLGARLSYGKTDADKNVFRADRKGWTGVLNWGWDPTAKIHTDTRISYETNARSRAGDADTADQPVRLLSLAARYDVTAKVQANAGVSFAQRSLDSENPGSQTDRRRTLSLGIDWAALRNVSLGCSIGRETREPSALIPGGYYADTGSCTVRAVLQ